MDPTTKAALLRVEQLSRGVQSAVGLALQSRRTEPRPNLARVLSAAAEDRPFHGEDAEAFQEAARVAGKPFDRYRLPMRWRWLHRGLSTAVGGGGYLVETDVPTAFDALRPWSVTAQAGMTILEGLKGTTPLPVTSAHATAAWLTDETTASTPSSPTVGSLALVPKTAAVTIDYSRKLTLMAPDLAEPYVMSELGRTLGSTADAAAFAGSGGSGEPLGILGTPGIGTQDGTSLTQAVVAAMKKAVSVANAADSRLAFVGTPAVRELLEARERAAGSGFIWDADRVASVPAYASTDVPAATLIVADWSRVIFALWGDGFELSITPYASAGRFQSGTISARAIVTCDVGVLTPAAVCAASSIT